MIRVISKKNDEGFYEIEYKDEHPCILEALSIIDVLIRQIEKHGDYSYRKVIKLIKEVRKNSEMGIEDGNINNTDK